jgi:hypothetical protein
MAEGITVSSKSAAGDVSSDYNFDEIRPIAGLVGLDTHNLSDPDKASIKSIYDFIRGDSPEMTDLELLHKVRELENRLGMTTLGERRLDKITRYVKLQSQIQGLEKQRDRELR